MEKTNTIPYQHFASLDDVPDKYREILIKARNALPMAYAPYSAFRVGACILTRSGKWVIGINVENASYPLCMCAERNAIARLVSQEVQEVAVAIGIVADRQDVRVSPCGACRQVLAELEERQGVPLVVLFQGEQGSYYKIDRVTDILPFSFSSSSLPQPTTILPVSGE